MNSRKSFNRIMNFQEKDYLPNPDEEEFEDDHQISDNEDEEVEEEGEFSSDESESDSDSDNEFTFNYYGIDEDELEIIQEHKTGWLGNQCKFCRKVNKSMLGNTLTKSLLTRQYVCSGKSGIYHCSFEDCGKKLICNPEKNQYECTKKGHRVPTIIGTTCKFCFKDKFKGTSEGFCCSKGEKVVESFKKLSNQQNDEEFNKLIQEKRFSSQSRRMNYFFSFSTQLTDPKKSGEGEGFICPWGTSVLKIHGKPYHMVFGSKRTNEQKPRRRSNEGIFFLVHDDNYITEDIRKDPKLLDWYNRLKLIIDKENPIAKSFKPIYNEIQSDPFIEYKPEEYEFKFKYDKHKKHVFAVFRTNDVGNILPDRSLMLNPQNEKVWEEICERYDLNIPMKENQGVVVPMLSLFYETLQYPLLFVCGSPGWFCQRKEKDPTSEIKTYEKFKSKFILHKNYKGEVVDLGNEELTIREYTKQRLFDERIQRMGRLMNEYVIDMYCRQRQNQLNYYKYSKDFKQKYLKYNTKKFKENEDIIGLLHNNEETVYLPPSFVGGPRYKRQKRANAQELCDRFDPPTFFITVTCNAKWDDITENIYPGQTWADRPDVVCKVFLKKIRSFLEDIRTGYFFQGRKPVYYIAVIEFQNRGLPHAHIALRIQGKQPVEGYEIDQFISARLPDKDIDPEYFKIINEKMLHTCHHSGSCKKLKNGEKITWCKWGYPFSTQPETIMLPNGCTSYSRGPNDSKVVANNRKMVMKYRCHINCERANPKCISYLFKYMTKGEDRTKVRLERKKRREDPNVKVKIDETREFVVTSYLSAMEATWRIFGGQNFFDTIIHPSVMPLIIHGELNKKCKEDSGVSTLLQYLGRPINVKDDGEDFNAMKYIDFHENFMTVNYSDLPKKFKLSGYMKHLPQAGIYRRKPYLWVNRVKDLYPKKNNQFVYRLLLASKKDKKGNYYRICRMHMLFPTKKIGDVYYLRILLEHTKPRSFEELITYKGKKFNTYKKICIAMDLIDPVDHFERCIVELIEKKYCYPGELRSLVCLLIKEGAVLKNLLSKYFYPKDDDKMDTTDDFDEKKVKKKKDKKDITRDKSKRKYVICYLVADYEDFIVNYNDPRSTPH